jgi:V8-like Glu-specific endopeptidase
VAAVIDAFPYPWHLPDARELHVVLCQLYPTAKGALFAAQRAGLDPAFLNADQPPYMVWKDVLEAGATALRTRQLVEQARDQHATNPRRAFLEALLQEQRPVSDSEPRGAFGAPAFVLGTDEISEPEALLFYDDLTLPIGRVSWLIGVLQKLQSLAPAVCRLEVDRNGQKQRGSAFRIAPDLLLSNWHVLTIGGAAASAVTAEFGYDDDGKGGGLQSTAVSCDVASIQTDKTDDWGIIRPSEPLPHGVPILKLSEAASPSANEPAFIIQHPRGERKRIAYTRNQVTSFDKHVVHYLSDTQGGSSGSPVLNDAGRLIALHHAGGRPQEVAGKPPLTKNEGIAIEAVLRGLTNAGLTVP